MKNKHSLSSDSFNIANELNKALKCHQACQLDEAEEIYEKILDVDPNHPDALHLLGFIAHQKNRNDVAVNLITKAIQYDPESPFYYNNLGLALKEQGKSNEAIVCYKKALHLDPGMVETHYNMGNVLQDQGRLAESISCYQKALELSPCLFEAYNKMGFAFKSQGKLPDAVSSYRKAIEIEPGIAELYHNLALSLLDQGQFAEVISCYQKALRLAPNHHVAYMIMGNAFQFQGKLTEAISSYEKAIEMNPECAEAYSNLGFAYCKKGDLKKTISNCYKALEIRPDYAAAYNNLGVVYGLKADIEQSISCYKKALELSPDDPLVHSNLLMAMLCFSGITSKDMFLESKNWWKRHGEPDANHYIHENRKNPQKRLRIGYVSPDFRHHSVSYFFMSLLMAHNRDDVEVVCYSDVKRPDEITDCIKGLSDHWRSTLGLTSEAVAEQVWQDSIDILVDLAGHTGDNRLPVFAYKPAPVQVTWLGYPCTTGMPVMDYRLTDWIADPEGEDVYYTETLFRLPQGFLCYYPPDNAPEISDLPARDEGRITFGSFNNLAKVTEKVAMVWSEILHQVPGSSLLLKSKPLGDGSTRRRYLELFLDHGIPPARIKMLPRVSSKLEHLALYNKVDISLDTFPYNGTTTTCEALWMGVPVVTLSGNRHSGRVGTSILTRIGLTELISATENDYVAKAVELATDIEHLRELRTNMRSRMNGSPLCDAEAFACDVENAFRKMWREYCDTANPGVGSE